MMVVPLLSPSYHSHYDNKHYVQQQVLPPPLLLLLLLFTVSTTTRSSVPQAGAASTSKDKYYVVYWFSKLCLKKEEKRSGTVFRQLVPLSQPCLQTFITASGSCQWGRSSTLPPGTATGTGLSEIQVPIFIILRTRTVNNAILPACHFYICIRHGVLCCCSHWHWQGPGCR